MVAQPDQLEGEVALVTGAAGGIGPAVVRALLEAGSDVAMTDLTAHALEGASQTMGDRDVLVVAGDAADSEFMRKELDAVEERYGPISILVNCVGAFRMQYFDDISDSEWNEVVSANLTTVFVACREAGARMKGHERGSIVNVASTAGEEGSFRPAAHYAAAKGGVIALTKTLARELASSGVRVNAVSPGPIDTPSLQATTDEARAEAASRTLIGRIGTPEEVANAVLYLVNPGAGYVTGEVLRVNGGSLL